MKLNELFRIDPQSADSVIEFNPKTVSSEEFVRMAKEMRSRSGNDFVIVNGTKFKSKDDAFDFMVSQIQDRIDKAKAAQQKWNRHTWNAPGKPYAKIAEMVPVAWLKKLKGNDLRGDPNIGYDPDKDDWERGTMDDLVYSLKNRGVQEPVMIIVGLRDGYAYVGEGNHRIEAAIKAGIKELPTRVVVYDKAKQHSEIGQYSHDVRNDLTWDTEQLGYMPEEKYFQKPSQVFRSLQKITEALTAAQHRARMLGKMFPNGKTAKPDKTKEEVKKALDKMKSPSNIRDLKEGKRIEAILNDFVYIENPSSADFLTMLQKTHEIRGIFAQGKVWIWPAFDAVHVDLDDEFIEEGKPLPEHGKNRFDFILADHPEPVGSEEEWYSSVEISPSIWFDVFGEDIARAMRFPAMKRFLPKNLPENIQELKETFDTPYSFDWSTQNETKFSADFATNDDSLVKVDFERFDDNWLVGFSKNGDFESTNEGDEFRILGTVLEVIREFIKMQNPKQIYFVAEKNPNKPDRNNSSRIKVYSSMAKKFAKSVGYSLAIRDQGWKSVFYLSKDGISENKQTYSPPDIDVGDTVLVGKFKNRKAEVKGFETDDKTKHPILKTTKGDVQLFKPRIAKLMPESEELDEGLVQKYWIHPVKQKNIDTSDVHHTEDAFENPTKYGLSSKVWGNHKHSEYLYDEAVAKVMHQNGWARVSDNGADWSIDAKDTQDVAQTLKFMRSNNFLFDSIHVKTEHEQFLLTSPQQIKLFIRTGKRPNSISGAFREDLGEEL